VFNEEDFKQGARRLNRLPELALRQRRQGLAKQLPPVTDILRGSLVERYVTCGNPACKCSRGERHGPIWYLTVTLGRGLTTGGIIPEERWLKSAVGSRTTTS
jgi:hypothetical protein